MLVSHYGAAMLGKAGEPRLPLWAYALAAQAQDIGWSILVLAGIEKAHVDLRLSGVKVVHDSIPYSHSLAASVLWALAAVAISRFAKASTWRTSIMLGTVTFSHWFLDVLGHRPDMTLWPGGTGLGLGLMGDPTLSTGIEVALLGLGAAAWSHQRGRSGRTLYPVVAFFGMLVILQILSAAASVESIEQVARNSLILHLLLCLGAWLADRPASTRQALALAKQVDKPRA